MTEHTTTNGLEASGMGGPALFKALAEFQATRPRAVKDGKSNFGKFATYESVLEAAQAAHGLGLSFTHIMDEDMMITILAHSSGQFLTSRMRVLADRQNAHGFGSGMSYTKRYCIAAMLGIPAVQDDDGNLAMASTGHEGQTKKNWRQKEARERAEAERKAKHSPDFKEGKLKFIFPRLKELELTMEEVNDYTDAFDRPRISGMRREQAQDLLKGLETPGSDIRNHFDKWRKDRG